MLVQTYIYIYFFFSPLNFLFICSPISAFEWQQVTFAEDRSCRQMSRWQEAQWHSGTVWHVGVVTGASSLCSWSSHGAACRWYCILRVQNSMYPQHTQPSAGVLCTFLLFNGTWSAESWVTWLWVHVASSGSCLLLSYCGPWKTVLGNCWWDRKSFVPVKGTSKLTGNHKTFIFQWSKLANPSLGD